LDPASACGTIKVLMRRSVEKTRKKVIFLSFQIYSKTLDHIKKSRIHMPLSRANEMLSTFKTGLRISGVKASFKWGIPVPLTKAYYIFLIDALSNLLLQ
jgi:methionyl-tRNA synthetase